MVFSPFAKIFSAPSLAGALSPGCCVAVDGYAGSLSTALLVLDDPGCQPSAQHFSFGHNFMRPQDAKLTGVCFKVQVIPYVSVQVDINYVVASAINLLAFAT